MDATTGSLGLDGGTTTSGGVMVNARVQLCADGDIRVVVVVGVPAFRYQVADLDAEDLVVAQLLLNRLAKAGELAAALGRPLRSIHRARERFVEGGAAGVARGKRGPKEGSSWSIGSAQEKAIRVSHAAGASMREIGRRLGVSAGTVRSAMLRMGLEPPSARERQLPLDGAAETSAEDVEDEGEASELGPAAADVESAAVESAPTATGESSESVPRVETATLDTDPADRSIDRMLARLGLLRDAAPLFAPGEDVPRAGVLLAVPLLVASGVFEEAEKTYGDIGPAFYGLRTMLLTLLLLALLRVKRPENLKETSPVELGRLLGLDRAPEVKTVRRKLAVLTAEDGGRSEKFLDALVRRRISARSEALGFLYVDGHVRVYHGQVDLPKTHVARLRLALPATQDVWVNDADGHPLLFVTQEAHPQLVGALPPLLRRLRSELGERRIAVVFDRGGWSPKLFQWMDAHGFDVLTYRKGASEPVPEERFARHERQTPHGRVVYMLDDTTVTVDGGFSMRQVTRLQEGHQTKVMTTRHDLPAMDVATRMFDRWRQENFFKYMREQYAIDALVQHGVEFANADREVPNPARGTLDRALRKARKEVARLEAQYGAAALDNEESLRPTMRGFKIANGAEIGIPLRQARAEVERLIAERRALPARVRVGEAKGEALRLPKARKRLSDGLKMLAYQVETDLVRNVAPHYKRSIDEGRRLIIAALSSAADIAVVKGELRVAIAPQSSPHRSRAIAELCTLLNATDTRFPGTDLVLRYAVKPL